MRYIQSAAHPAGDHATLTGQLFQNFFCVTGVFFALVLIFLGWAIWRRDRGNADDQRLRVTVAVWAGAITLSLFGLTLASYLTDRHLAFASAAKNPLDIQVTGQQWWWQVDYHDPVQSDNVVTANEIHLPLGRLARIELRSDDVIHSLWIPSLAGKQDLIPGRKTDLHILPRQTGHFRAQCAEFCGLQHANMALDVIVETPQQFAAWAKHSREPAPSPITSQQQHGMTIVTSEHCGSCHAITGTDAYGNNGPDLTHVASRATLAAAALPNAHSWLNGWIADPQAIKPGNRMPKIPMSDADRAAVVAYLETLK